MNMFCPAWEGDSFTKPEKKKQLKQRLAMVEEAHHYLVSSRPGTENDLSLETAKKLLRIIDANAHAFSRTPDDALIIKNYMPRDETALFARGSKVEHSCAPNLTYTAQHGKLLYRATRSIKKGSRISISYQAGTIEHPLDQRRDFLRENKEFTCRCVRCMGPDECNPYYAECPVCDDPKAVVVWYENASAHKCVTCQSTISVDIRPQQKMEAEFQQRLQGYEFDVRSGRAMNRSSSWMTNMMQLQTEMANRLHPLHWLHLAAYRVMGSWPASWALMGLQDGKAGSSPAVKRFLYCSTLAQLQQAQWLQVNGDVVYQSIQLEDAANGAVAPILSVDPTLKDLRQAVNLLKQEIETSGTIERGIAHPVFHAGLDWLLAGDCKEVADLFRMCLPLFQQWDRLREENRNYIAILVHSDGAENPFPNHLL